MPLYPKLTAPPAAVPEHVARATIEPADARAIVTREIQQSVLRPRDIGEAKTDEPAFFYAPFWRVRVSVEGFHIGLTTTTSSRGRTVPLPTGGARHAEGTIMISGRSILPYTPKLPSAFSRIAGAPALEVEPTELTAFDREALAGVELVDADVSKEHAERVAVGMIVAQVQPHSALYAKYDPLVHDATCIYYPLYFARYRYDGEARTHAGEEFFVLVSGRTGKVVSSKHPSALRAVTAKLRRFLSFDR